MLFLLFVFFYFVQFFLDCENWVEFYDLNHGLVEPSSVGSGGIKKAEIQGNASVEVFVILLLNVKQGKKSLEEKRSFRNTLNSDGN